MQTTPVSSARASACSLVRVAGRTPAVVVADEQGRDQDRIDSVVPDRVRVLGRHHAEAAAQRHQILVARLAAQLHLVVARGPELVVAGGPDHLGEAAPQQVEGPFDVGGVLSDIARDDEPVAFVLRAELLDEGAVLGVHHVQVADRQQPSDVGPGHRTSRAPTTTDPRHVLIRVTGTRPGDRRYRPPGARHTPNGEPGPLRACGRGTGGAGPAERTADIGVRHGYNAPTAPCDRASLRRTASRQRGR